MLGVQLTLDVGGRPAEMCQISLRSLHCVHRTNVGSVVASSRPSLIRAAELSFLAVGLTMVYSVLRFPNFAHVEFATLGAYMALLFSATLTLPLWLAAAAGLVLIGALGVAIIAWLLAQGQDIVTLVGVRARDRPAEALGALDIHLDGDDLAAIERAVPKDAAASERYAAAQMAMLDSERGQVAQEHFPDLPAPA